MEHKSCYLHGNTRWIIMFAIFAILAATFTTAEAKSSKTLRVPATARWVNTGIQLAAGQQVVIKAKVNASTLKTSPSSNSGPNG